MKKIKIISTAVVFALTILVSLTPAFALGMTAGTVRILVDVGSSNTSRFGLVNNGNETITVMIRAEGDAAQFLEIPSKLEIDPKNLTYVNIIATIPSTYDGSFGGNITGFIYAVQQGAPGQVQVNVQAQKAVQILIPQYGGRLPETTAQVQQTQQVQTQSEGNVLTGFASLANDSALLMWAGAGAAALIVFIVFIRRFDISIKPKNKTEVKNE